MVLKPVAFKDTMFTHEAIGAFSRARGPLQEMFAWFPFVAIQKQGSIHDTNCLGTCTAEEPRRRIHASTCHCEMMRWRGLLSTCSLFFWEQNLAEVNVNQSPYSSPLRVTPPKSKSH